MPDPKARSAGFRGALLSRLSENHGRPETLRVIEVRSELTQVTLSTQLLFADLQMAEKSLHLNWMLQFSHFPLLRKAQKSIKVLTANFSAPCCINLHGYLGVSDL